jgi:ribosomal protein L6P/L9E
MLKKINYITIKIPNYITYSSMCFLANTKFLKYVFKGPLGNIFNYFINYINLNINLKKNYIFFLSDKKNISSFLNLYSSLLKNIFKGLISGFNMFIRLKGLSYRI